MRSRLVITRLIGPVALTITLILSLLDLCEAKETSCKHIAQDVICKNLGLLEPPGDLPSQINKLDLSNNPDLKIPKNFFKHRTIHALVLTGCKLKKPFVLPKDVRDLSLKDNRFTHQSVSEMFYYTKPSLLSLDISNNSIDGDRGFDFLKFSPNLKQFKFCGNQLYHLGHDHLRYFSELNKFSASEVGMRRISSDAFSHTRNLIYIDLGLNLLKTLPERIFRYSSTVKTLLLGNNGLTSVPDLSGLPSEMFKLDLSNNNISKLQGLLESNLKYVSYLYLQRNAITQLPKELFQNLRVAVNLDISKNLIQSLEADSFRSFEKVSYILLNQNDISSISPYAFRGIQQVYGGLFLFMNKFTALPKSLFQNMTINRLLIHSCKIADMSNTFIGIAKDPNLLVFFDNEIHYIKSAYLEGLTPQANVILSCKDLRSINMTELRGIKLKCSPLSSFQLNTVDKQIAVTLKKAGFKCHRHRKDYLDCIPCPTGHYNDGREYCVPCPKGGFYQDNTGQQNCKVCLIGQFVNHTAANSSLECMACPVGANTNGTAGTRACKCLPGFFRVHRFDGCARCNSYGVHCQNDFKELIKDHWWSFFNDTKTSQYYCYTDGLLKTGVDYNHSCISFFDEVPRAHICPIEGACLGGVRASCLENYTDVLCDACSSNYYRHLSRCVKCPLLPHAILKVVLAVVIFVLICALIKKFDNKSLSQQSTRTVTDVILSSLKITVNFYQTLSVILLLLADVPWPKALIAFSLKCRYFEMAVISVGSLRCVFSSLQLTIAHELVISLAVTIGVPFLIVVILRLRICCTACKEEDREKVVANLKKESYRYISLFLFTTYKSTSERVFKMLPPGCLTLCSDYEKTNCRSFVRADVRVRCDTPTHQVLVYLAYAGLIVPLGYPLMVLILVYWATKTVRQNHVQVREDPNGYDYPYVALQQRSQIESDDDDSETSGDEDEHNHDREEEQPQSPVKFAIKFLHENYKPSEWYWEFIEIMKKLVLVMAVSIFERNTRTNLGIFISMSGFFAIFYAYKQPVKDKSEHFLQMAATTVIFLNSCAGVLLGVSPAQAASFDERTDSQGLGIILFMLNAFIIAAVVAKIVSAVVIELVKWFRRQQSLKKALIRCIREFLHLKEIKREGHRPSKANHSEMPEEREELLNTERIHLN